MKKEIDRKRAKFAMAFLCLLFCLAEIGCGHVPTMNEDETVLQDIITDMTNASSEEMTTVSDEKSTQESVVTTHETIEVTEESEEAPPEISLIMVGDILLHTPVAESALQADGSYDFDAIFANVCDEIQAADVALVNQEVIVGGTQLGVTGYPSFNAPYELGDALVETGFDVVLHATNHTLDKGKKGVESCLAFWETNYPNMAVLGMHGSEEDQQEIYVYEQDGIRIAILNYTYGTNGIPLPDFMPYAVDLLEKERVVADLQRAEKIADFTIVCPHWGTEYQLEESAEQTQWAELFHEYGADLVIGTHPHVIQPVKWIDDTLVYYSLGNFVNWTSSEGDGIANRMVGGMAQVDITRNEAGEVVISDYEMIPLVCHVQDGTNNVSVYFMDEYTEELASQNEIIMQDNAFSLTYCRDLWEKVVFPSF